MSGSNCCFLTYIEVSQEAGQVVWYSHLLNNFPQFVVIHTVKGFGVVSKAEADVFLNIYFCLLLIYKNTEFSLFICFHYFPALVTVISTHLILTEILTVFNIIILILRIRNQKPKNTDWIEVLIELTSICMFEDSSVESQKLDKVASVDEELWKVAGVALHPVLPLGSKPFSYLPPFSFCYTLSCHWDQNHSPMSHASLSVWPNVTVEIKTWCWDELWFSSIRSQLYFTVVFPGGPDGKASACGVGEQVQSLGREETLKKEIPTQARILVNPMDRGAWQATVHRVGKSRMWLKRQHAHTHEPRTSCSELGHSLPSHTVLGLNPISRVY